MGGLRTGAALCAAVLLLGALRAQPAAAKPTPVGNVKLVNITGYDRRDVVTVVHPFPESTYRGEPLVVVDGPYTGVAAQHTQLGASWPDGSWRHALVHVPARLGPRETAVRSLATGNGARPAFQWTNAVAVGAARFSLSMRIGTNLVSLGPWKLMENGHLVNAWRARARVPNTTFWIEAWLEFGSGLDHARFWLHYGNSDPRDPDVTHAVGPIDLIVTGVAVRLRFESDKALSRNTTGDVTVMRLEQGSTWADGESQALKGVLLFIGGHGPTLRAETEWPVFAGSLEWQATGTFGPWGFLPDPPPGETPQTIAARAVSDWKAHNRGIGDPWAAPVLGCLPTPGGTGDQADFSAVVATAGALGHLERLHAIGRSVYREACRPTHLRNADASPLAIGADPSILLWNGRPDHRITRNKLGKSRGLAGGEGHYGNGISWWGRDRQHWSCNYLAFYALLTGDRWARHECEHLVELWLGEMRIRSGSPVLDGMGAPRGAGRTLQAAAHLYLVTGRNDLATRARERVTVTENGWTGRNTSPHRPAGANAPDGRNLGGQYSFTMPWQDGLGACGLDAIGHVLRHQPAIDLAALWARDMQEHGIFPLNTRLTAAKAVQWKGGAWDGWQEWTTGSPAAQPGDPNYVEFYRPYLTWMSPALVVNQRDATLEPTATQALGLLSSSWRSWEWRALR